MAENPLVPNTEAQQKGTEAADKQTKATEELTRALQQAAPKVPAPTPSPGNSPLPAGGGAVGELSRRLQALLEFYRQNPTQGPNALAAQGLRGRINTLSSSISKAFGMLSPDEQRLAAPALRAMESRRQEVRAEEMRPRDEARRRHQGELAAAREARETAQAGERLRREREQLQRRQEKEQARQETQNQRLAQQASRALAREVEQQEKKAAREAKESAREQERQKREGPLPNLSAELRSRYGQLHDYYRSGGKPDDMAAKALRARVAEQEGHVGRKFAGMTPEEQKKAMPAMKALETRRREVEEEELRRREKLNKGLSQGSRAIEGFIRGLGSGSVTHAATGILGAGGGPLGGILTAAMGAMTTIIGSQLSQYLSDVRQGGRTLYQSGAQTEEQSRELRRLQEARRAGEPQRQESRARLEQLRAQAEAMNMPRREDPMSGLRRIFGEADRARIAAEAEQIRVTIGTGSVTQGQQAFNRAMGDYFERWIREHGGTPHPMRRDVVMPPGVEGGYTSAMGYQQELQVNSLQRNDLSNQILQEQLRQLNEANQLLRNINNNTNGLEGDNRRWGG